MTDGGPHPFKALIARLATEAEWRLLAKPDAGVLVWDRSGERLLWASPSAAGLREAFADEAGHVLPDFRARERIRTLAGGEAPWAGSAAGTVAARSDTPLAAGCLRLPDGIPRRWRHGSCDSSVRPHAQGRITPSDVAAGSRSPKPR